MPAYRKASIRELTQSAVNLDGRFVQGVLRRDPESGDWMVGSTLLEEWVARYEGQEITAIVLSMDEGRPLQKQICHTCGREYIGYECPYCKEVRRRLRGR